MNLKPLKGVSAVIITFNNHLGNAGLLTEGNNSVLILQAPSKKQRSPFPTDKKKLQVVNSALREMKKKLDHFEKLIVYAGEGLGPKIIRLVNEHDLPAEKVLFVASESDWGEKENETLLSVGLSKAQVVKYDGETSDVIYNIHRNILTKGIFPH